MSRQGEANSWRLAAAAALAGIIGCGGDLGERCQQALATGSYVEAAELCTRAYQRRADPPAGAAAAVAELHLGRRHEVLAWAQRLAGSSRAAAVEITVARLHQKEGRRPQAEAGYRRAIALAEAANQPAYAARAGHRLSLIQPASAALETLERAFVAAERAGERDLLRSLVLLLFDRLYEIGDLEAARAALARAEPLTDRRDHESWAYLRLKQGLLEEASGALALALPAYEEALAVSRRAPRQDADLIWSIALNQLSLAVDMGDLERADRHLATATGLLARRPAPVARAEAALLYRQGKLELARGRLREAGELYDRALALRPHPDTGWRAATARGRLAETLGELATAESGYRAAATIVEELRAAGGSDDFKPWILASRHEPFARLFALQARAGRALDALATFEATRARTFVDALVAVTAREREAAPARSAAEPGQRSRVLESLLPRLRNSPVVALRPIEEVRATVGAQRALLYFETADQLFVVALDGQRLWVQTIAAPLAEIARLTSQLVMNPDDRTVAERLGTLLIPPLSPASPDHVLYLAPSELLARLPFAALRPRGQLLIQQAALAQVPSLTALAAALRAPRAPRAARSSRAVVLADPGGDLPEARREALEVARHLGADAALGAEASRAAWAAARDAEVLHVSGHSGVNGRGPWAAAADGEVLGSDVLDWNLRPRLVVLASCASAATRHPGPWGSLAASFLASGAGAVVGALQSVEDRAARDLVLDFYRQGGARDPVRALARAQRRAARARPAAAWAPFVVFGGEQTSVAPLSN